MNDTGTVKFDAKTEKKLKKVYDKMPDNCKQLWDRLDGLEINYRDGKIEKNEYKKNVVDLLETLKQTEKCLIHTKWVGFEEKFQ